MYVLCQPIRLYDIKEINIFAYACYIELFYIFWKYKIIINIIPLFIYTLSVVSLQTNADGRQAMLLSNIITCKHIKEMQLQKFTINSVHWVLINVNFREYIIVNVPCNIASCKITKWRND